MIEQIEISGEVLDLFPENNVNLNLRLNTIGDIGTRNSTYSNTITIPRTSRNQKLLQHAGVIGHRSTIPYTETRVRYSRGNVTLIKDGIVRLKETTATTYQIVIFDGVIDFASGIGTKTLRDLTYIEEVHYLNQSTVANSFLNTSGYIYALAEFGKQTTAGSAIEIQNMLPSIYAHTIWDKIFTQNGFTYSGDFFTSNAEWKQLLVLPGEGIDTETGGTEVETPLGGASSDTLDFDDTYGSFTSRIDDHALTSDTFTADLSRTAGNIVANYTGVLRLELSNTYTIDPTETVVYFRVYKNGSMISNTQLTGGSPLAQTLTLGVNSTDVISFKCSAVSVSNPPYTSFIIDYTSSFTVTATKITGGVEIDPQTFVPEMEQSKFVKDILQRYGLLMLKDNFNQTEYRFLQLDALLDDRANAVSWTDKLVRITSERYESGYAQSNKGEYGYTDGVSPSHDGALLVSNQNSPLERTIFSSPFQIPASASYTFNSQTMYNVPIWNVRDADTENVQTTEKLMRVNFDGTDASVVKNGTGALAVTDPIPYASLVNMSYQYFLDNYFINFGALLDGYKEIEAEVALNEVDLNNLDLFKLVYLQQTGQFYYIDTVSTGGAIPRAKMIEIPTFNN